MKQGLLNFVNNLVGGEDVSSNVINLEQKENEIGMGKKVQISYDVVRLFIKDLLANNQFTCDDEIVTMLRYANTSNAEGYVSTYENAHKLIVNCEMRILLSAQTEVEVKMPLLSKALFLFFLIHPEGVEFKGLHQYYEELLYLYQLVAKDKNLEKGRMQQALSNLVEPVNNRIYEACSIIRKSLLKVVDAHRADEYCITGSRGGVHRIRMNRKHLVVEHEELMTYMESIKK